MRLKLSLARPGGAPDDDLLVTVDTTVTVGALAAAIARNDPRSTGVVPPSTMLTLRLEDGAVVLSPSATVADAELRSGQAVALVDARSSFGEAQSRAAVATAVVVSGPDAGQQHRLRPGSNQVGRERCNDVRLSDLQVSKYHARINVTEVVEIIDLGSSNGTIVGGDVVARAVLRAEDEVQLGDTVLRISHSGQLASAGALGVEFNRSPRLDVVYQGVELPAPEPPKQLRPQRVPVIPLIAPVLLGCLMFAITRQLVTIVFVALSPLMLLGNVLESRIFGRKELAAAIEEFHSALDQLRSDLVQAAGEEAVARRAEHPPTVEVCTAILRREPMLWSRRPDQRGFLEVRVGLGALPSRNSVALPHRGDGVPGLWAELLRVRAEHATVEALPVVLDLVASGSVGIAGPRAASMGLARSVVVQLTGLHSPAELVVAAVAPAGHAPEWDWLKWLPHTSSDHSPIEGDHLASSPGMATRLVAELETLVDARRAERGAPEAGPSVPSVVVVVEDDAPVERSRLVELGERGRGVGVHLVWIAVSVSRLPAACRAFVEVDPATPAEGNVGYVDGGRQVDRVALEPLDARQALLAARVMSPVIDAGARVDDASDLPRSVSLLGLVDAELARSAAAVVDRWRTSNSLPAETAGVRRKKDNHLRAAIGQGAGQSLVLDLREHGPHALVGGTTGSGKSEFLQSWIAALALDHSPARVTFLFVDYKGGAAFSECVQLPHSVGLVTDLSPHLVRRALRSLNAELRHREHLLQAKKAKDLLELERRGDPEAPPSLVIVVDEFAALVKEVPEFVDGVVNVAQRGRSLGLHLVLATQRPAGVIKDNLRANTNLRVALRMADDGDSDDVVGTKAAAGFDPGVPGRAIAKVGPGRLTPFQSGYVGGWTADTPPPPVIRIEELSFGTGALWDRGDASLDEPPPKGPNDLQRLVENVRRANEQVGLPAPRRPWLDTLAAVYDLARTPQSRNDAELIYGIADDPDAQQQVPAAFHPDRDGNMAVYGTGGAGKSGLLRTLAVAAGVGFRGGPCHVYGLDFGARGLQMLEPLAHVGSVINGEDDERIRRLLRHLRQTIDERAARYATVNAGSITEYRTAAERPDEARILLLVDGLAAFRQAYETGANIRWFEMFQSIAADGRQVGVHMVVTADRASAVPTALGSVIQKRVVLRLAAETEYSSLDVPPDALAAASPPGRGFVDGREVQVAILGGSADTSRQASAVRRLAGELASASGRPPAPAVQRLVDRVRLGELPVTVGGAPSLGVRDDDLGPLSFATDDVLLVVGPPQSGRTSTMATIALSLQRARSGRLAYLGPGRSPLRTLAKWAAVAVGPNDVAELARALTVEVQRADDVLGVFVEDISSFINTPAETPLLDLVKSCRAADVLLAADAETGSLASWPLQLAVKAPRHGIALQPDQLDGDNIFKTTFPRVSRAEFPPGRGFYVHAGRAVRFQAALPEVDAP